MFLPTASPVQAAVYIYIYFVCIYKYTLQTDLEPQKVGSILGSRDLESLLFIPGFCDGNPGCCFAPQPFGVFDSFFHFPTKWHQSGLSVVSWNVGKGHDSTRHKV